MIYLNILCVFGLFVAFTFEATAMKSRVVLNNNGKDTFAVTIGKIFLLLNRFGIALSMPVFGLLIDFGATPSQIALLFGYGFLGSFVCIQFFVVRSEISDRATGFLMRRVFHNNLEIPEARSEQISITKKGLLVGTLNAAGLSIPAISASSYPEYSTFLIQTGFLINSLAAILNVFAIDVSNTRSLQTEAGRETVLANVNSKSVAYLAFSVVLIFAVVI